MKKWFIECHREGDFTPDTWFTVEAKDRAGAKRAAAKQLKADDDLDCRIADVFDDPYVLDSLTEVAPDTPDGRSPIMHMLDLVEQLLGNINFKDQQGSDFPKFQQAHAAALAWAAERYDVA
jgi:hypothetical protein